MLKQPLFKTIKKLAIILLPAAFIYFGVSTAQAAVGLSVGNTNLNLAPAENLYYGNIGSTSDASSSFLLFQKNSGDIFKVDSNGNLTTNGSVTANAFSGPITGGSISAANVSNGAFGSNTGGGNYNFPTNLGIGDATPSYRLELAGASGTEPTGIKISGSATNGLQLRIGDPYSASFGTRYSGAETYVASNAYQSTLSTDAWAKGVSNYGSTMLMLGIPVADTSAAFQIKYSPANTANGGINTLFPNTLMTVLGNGSVGIGTTGPGTTLQIGDYFGISKGDASYMGAIGFNRNPATGAIYNGASAAHQIHNNLGKLVFQTYNSGGSLLSNSVIDSTGNVGIGTTAPSSLLNISGGALRINNINTWPTSVMVTGTNRHMIGGSSPVFVMWNEATPAAGNTSDIWLTAKPASSATALGGGTIKSGLENSTNSAGFMSFSTTPALSVTNVAEAMRINSSQHVGIGNTNPVNAKLEVNSGNIFINSAVITSATPKAAITKEYLDSALSTSNLWSGTKDGNIWNGTSGTGNVGIGTTSPGVYRLNVAGATYIGSTLTMGANINMSSNDINGVNKLTVNTVDPLYRIKGANYASFASAIVGGVKEEYSGREEITKKDGKGAYEKIIDFDSLPEGSDLWVWHKVVDFSANNVEVSLTPYGGFAQVYYNIEGNKLILHSDRKVTVSLRITGKRFDWKQWPTKPEDQSDNPSLIIE